MSFEKEIRQRMEPLFQAQHWHLCSVDRSFAKFMNEAETIRACFEVQKRPPTELLTASISGIEAGAWRLPPSSVHITLSLKNSYRWELIDPCQKLSTAHFASFITDRKQLGEIMERLAGNVIELFPRLEKLHTHLACKTEAMFHTLAEESEKRAARLSARLGIPLEATPTVLRCLQAKLDQLVEEKGGAAFSDVADEMLDYAALSGEIVKKKYSGSWQWFEMSRLLPSYPDYPDCYVVVIPEVRSQFGDFDPLFFVIDHWNRANIEFTYGLYRFQFTRHFE